MLGTPSGTVHFSLKQLEPFRDLAIDNLRTELIDPAREPLQRLHAVYGLMQFDAASPEDLELLLDGISDLPKDEGENLIDAMSHLLQNIDPLQAQEKLQKRIADAATEQTKNRLIAVAAELGITDAVAQVCSLQTDPSQRTSFVHGFSDFPGDLKKLAAVLLDHESLAPETRSALCIAVGKLGVDGKPATQSVLKTWYQTAPDGGTHSAARWALIQQGVSEEELVQLIRDRPQPDVEPAWKHLDDPAGLTMILNPSREFAMGSVTDDVGGDESSGWTGDPTVSDESVPFPSIWFSDREITFGQFETILPKFPDTTDENASKVPDHLQRPKVEVSWYDAIEFCNALSYKQGIKPYYRFSDSERIERDNYRHIQDHGGQNRTRQKRQRLRAWVSSAFRNQMGIRLSCSERKRLLLR